MTISPPEARCSNAVTNARGFLKSATNDVGDDLRMARQFLRSTPEIAAERAQPQTRQCVLVSQKGVGVGACLQNGLVALAYAEQSAVRLNAAGKMDLLSLAIRKIGGSKGGSR